MRTERFSKGENALMVGLAVAKPLGPTEAGAGHSKGCCGAMVLARWKASRVALSVRSLTRRT